jgi:hypothetical protein
VPSQTKPVSNRTFEEICESEGIDRLACRREAGQALDSELSVYLGTIFKT